MFHIIVLYFLKLCTFGIYFYDFTKTRKLLSQDRSIKRELYWYQKFEVYFFNILVIVCLFIPTKVINESFATLLQLICLILIYRHLNRWFFVSKKSVIIRDELIRTTKIVNAKYEKNVLTFRANSKNYKIRYPLVTKELLKKTIVR